MPKFVFNRLIRDKLKDDYERLGQKAVTKKLSKLEHLAEIKNKIVEEANEIPVDGDKETLLGEIADVQQAVDDFLYVSGLSKEKVEVLLAKKFDKKGGFSGGFFVETLELEDNDEWVEYYRKEPEKHREV